MSRIRNIKPGFFRSESLAALPVAARLTFAGLWTEADDFGRGIANAKVLCGALWSLDDDMTPEIVEEHIQMLENTGHITLYVVSGKRYFHVTSWEDNQSAQLRRGKPLYPDPSDFDAIVKNHDSIVKNHDPSVLDKGREGIREGNREGSNTSRATSVPDEFPVTEHLKAWLHAEDLDWLDPELETKKFLEWHGAKGTTFKDWTRAWYTWMRKAAEYAMAANGGKRPQNKNPNRKRSTFELTGGGAPRGKFHYEGNPIVLPGEV